jgi:serine/threonine protein phosphatase PrpC
LAFRGIKTTPHGVWFSKQKHLPNHKKNDHLLFFLEKKLPFPVCVLMDGSGSFAPNTTVGALKHQMHQQGEALFTTLWEYLNNGNNNQAIDTLSHFISTSVANTTGSSTFCCAIRTNKILHIISQGDSSALVFNGPNQTVTELTSDSEASFWYDSKGIQSPYYFKQCGGQPRLTHIRHDIQTGDQLCLMTDGVSNFFEKIGVEPVERQSTIIPSIYTTPSHQLTELITPLVQCLAFNPKKIALALYTLHEHIRHVHPDDATCYISSVFN